MKFKDVILVLSEKVATIEIHRCSDDVFKILDLHKIEVKDFVKEWTDKFSEDKVLKLEIVAPHILFVELT